MNLEVGDTVRVLGSAFRVVGIYETGVSFEDSGAVITLRDAQRLAGRPHQVALYGIKLRDPDRVEQVLAALQADFPEIAISLSTEFVENMPDMQSSNQMIGRIAFLAVLIGGVGMLNTMLRASWSGRADRRLRAGLEPAPGCRHDLREAWSWG
jgi:ABC-type lipoprotein release transport system permease subunit